MKITDINSNYIFETKKVEYKAKLNSPKPSTWLKTIVAFANCDGGELIVGVNDKDKNLCGFLESEIDNIVIDVNNKIKSYIEPNIFYDFKYIPYEEDNIKKFLIDIVIPRSKKLPVVLKNEDINIIYIRLEGSSVPATAEQIRNLIINSEIITNDEIETREKFDEKDFKKMYKVYHDNTQKDLTYKKLESINFFTADGFLKKGSLLFRDDCYDSNTIIHCRLWNSLTRGSNVVLDNKETRGNLFYILEFGLKFIMANTKTGFIKSDIGRKPITSYPQRAITEALVNAIVHRNYMISGSQIDIDIFKNRIEITSPGSLIGSSFKDNETDLKAIPSKRRNQLICDVFAICHLMEKSGSGFEKIVDDYSYFDERFKPSISSTNESFTIILKDVLFNENYEINKDFIIPPIEEGKRDFDKAILAFCLDEYKTATEIAFYIGKNKSSYFMKEYINPLINNELLLPFNTSNNSSTQKYITNKDKLIFK